MSSDRKGQLIETAMRFFKRDGFHATGIDKILAEAGVAKMTLYKHFNSKDELIAAVLKHYDELHRPWLIAETEKRATSPRGRLLALFDVYSDWIATDFEGCLFIKACIEHTPMDSRAHQAAKHHKDSLREYIRDLCAQTGTRHPDDLARQIMILLEGALVTATMNGESDSARIAQSVAHTLIASALPREVRQVDRA